MTVETEACRQEIRRMWLSGARLEDISAVLGVVSVGSVMSRMRQEGYDLPYHKERMRRLLDSWPAEPRE